MAKFRIMYFCFSREIKGALWAAPRATVGALHGVRVVNGIAPGPTHPAPAWLAPCHCNTEAHHLSPCTCQTVPCSQRLRPSQWAWLAAVLRHRPTTTTVHAAVAPGAKSVRPATGRTVASAISVWTWWNLEGLAEQNRPASWDNVCRWENYQAWFGQIFLGFEITW